MADISGFGLVVTVVASNTFPVGFQVTQFADDTDPFDVPSIQIADKAMGLNGDLVVWSTANPLNISLAVVPQTPDDTNLGILFEANRVARGKLGAGDIITMNAVYKNGKFITLTNGLITDGMPGDAVASAGRIKSKVYNFSFENVIGI
jgi:hypothetical protein